VTGTGRFVRMNGTARGTAFGYSLWEFQVFGSVNAAGCGTTNVAVNRPTAASSTENATFAPAPHRRQHRHPLVQRLQRPAVAPGRPRLDAVDLPGLAELGSRVRHGVPDPDIADAVNWTTIFSTTTGARRRPDLTVTAPAASSG